MLPPVYMRYPSLFTNTHIEPYERDHAIVSAVYLQKEFVG